MDKRIVYKGSYKGVGYEINSWRAPAIEDIDTKLTLVEKLQTGSFVVSEKVIQEIINSKVFDIKITRIFYESDGATGKKIGIDGTASSRERLLLFREALEENPAFKNVDLPISNFVKGSDISFHLNLAPSI